MLVPERSRTKGSPFLPQEIQLLSVLVFFAVMGVYSYSPVLVAATLDVPTLDTSPIPAAQINVVQASVDLHHRQERNEKMREPRQELEDANTTTTNTTNTKEISTALCYKTLFGPVDIHKLTLWAAYYKLLGIDRIFMWYLPELVSEKSPVKGNWSELESLPYLTLLPNTVGRTKSYNGYERVENGRPGDQWDAERWCLKDKAKDYDFVLFVDSDEFLWFREKVGLKEFLQPYRDYNYLSFGKYLYTLRHGVKTKKDTFGLDLVSRVVLLTYTRAHLVPM
jgi:hypothetical protein